MTLPKGQQPRQITIGEFIIKYGIEKLKDYPIRIGEIMGKIHLSSDDIKYHSRRYFNKDNKALCHQYRKVHKSEYFDHFHRHGSYRFYLIYNEPNDSTDYGHWVYKSDLVDEPQQSK